MHPSSNTVAIRPTNGISPSTTPSATISRIVSCVVLALPMAQRLEPFVFGLTATPTGLMTFLFMVSALFQILADTKLNPSLLILISSFVFLPAFDLPLFLLVLTVFPPLFSSVHSRTLSKRLFLVAIRANILSISLSFHLSRHTENDLISSFNRLISGTFFSNTTSTINTRRGRMLNGCHLSFSSFHCFKVANGPSFLSGERRSESENEKQTFISSSLSDVILLVILPRSLAPETLRKCQAIDWKSGLTRLSSRVETL